MFTGNIYADTTILVVILLISVRKWGALTRQFHQSHDDQYRSFALLFAVIALVVTAVGAVNILVNS